MGNKDRDIEIDGNVDTVCIYPSDMKRDTDIAIETEIGINIEYCYRYNMFKTFIH